METSTLRKRVPVSALFDPKIVVPAIGSAFAGLNANTPFWNVALGLDMLAGRFLMIIPAMGIAGLMVDKKVVPPSLGTFPTNGPLFVFLLVTVVVIVGALTFFPALSLGPIVEHFQTLNGKVF